MEDELLIKLAYVNISTYRAKATKALKDDVKTPTKSAEDGVGAMTKNSLP